MSTIKKQGIQNAIITYIGVIIGFVSLLFIQPNLLKPEELGLTRILVAAASLIATLLPMGVSGVTTKFFPYFRNAEKGHHGYFGFMLLFPLIGSLLCGCLIYLFKDDIINQYKEQSFLFTQYFDLLFPFSIGIGLNVALNAYCASLFKTRIISISEGIFARVMFILLITIYYFHWISLTQFLYLYVSISLLQAISLMIYIYIVDTPSLKIDASHLKNIGIKKLLQFGFLLTLSTVSSLSLKHLDTIMLGKYMGLELVGIFTVTAYISLVIEIPLTSLERITHTKVSQAWANNDVESIKKIYYQSVKYLLLIGGLLLIGIVLNIHDLLSFLPEAYHKGATVAVIACIGAFLNIVTGVNTSIIFTSEKYIYGTFLLIFLLILAFVLNLVFIPLWGIEGAALATTLSSAIYNLLKYFIIWKNFKMQPYDSSSVKIIGVIVFVFFIGYFLPCLSNAIVTIAFKAMAITTLYVGLIYYLKIAPELHSYISFKKNKQN